MEPKSKSPVGILGIIGGALLVIGSILPWAEVSLDLDAFASVLGVDPSVLAGSGAETSQSIGGLDADGSLTLVAGIVVLVCAGLFIAKRANTALGVLILLGGLAGAGIALYDILSKDRQLDEALAESGADLQEIGLTAETFKEVFAVSFSIGIYVCLVGGLVALAAGAMALMAKPDPAAASVAAGPVGTSGLGAPSSGFGTAPVTPGGSTPPASAVPPAETAPPPSALPSTAPDPVPPAPREDPPTSTP